jgi:type 1 glutamine amidotransferase
MGHREDVWANPIFQKMIVGALRWATKQADADLTPNIQQVTPQANTLPIVD